MDLIHMQLALGRLTGARAASLRCLHGPSSRPVQSTGLLQRCAESPPFQQALLEVDETLIRGDRKWVESEGVHLVDLWSASYPPQLRALANAPVVLYVRGDVATLSRQQLAMVGSRYPSISGRRAAHSFAVQLARAGLTITSGLAEGIDATSHEGALSTGGRSVAVLGTGIDQIYPNVNRGLAGRIASQGALVSELPPRSPPLRRNFPLRNRIISGLSLGVLVVEAAQKSGSLITAQLATSQKRCLFAIPGSIYNPMTRGCHALIRRGAKLVEDPAQILQQLGIGMPKQSLMEIPADGNGERLRPCELDKHYKILLDAVGFESTTVDDVVERTGLPSQSVTSMLLSLELEGAIGSLGDGQYVRLSSDHHAKQRF